MSSMERYQQAPGTFSSCMETTTTQGYHQLTLCIGRTQTLYNCACYRPADYAYHRPCFSPPFSSGCSGNLTPACLPCRGWRFTLQRLVTVSFLPSYCGIKQPHHISCCPILSLFSFTRSSSSYSHSSNLGLTFKTSSLLIAQAYI